MSKEMDLLRRLAEGDNRGDFFISLELLKEVEAILAQPEPLSNEQKRLEAIAIKQREAHDIEVDDE